MPLGIPSFLLLSNTRSATDFGPVLSSRVLRISKSNSSLSKRDSSNPTKSQGLVPVEIEICAMTLLRGLFRKGSSLFRCNASNPTELVDFCE